MHFDRAVDEIHDPVVEYASGSIELGLFAAVEVETAFCHFDQQENFVGRRMVRAIILRGCPNDVGLRFAILVEECDRILNSNPNRRSRRRGEAPGVQLIDGHRVLRTDWVHQAQFSPNQFDPALVLPVENAGGDDPLVFGNGKPGKCAHHVPFICRVRLSSDTLTPRRARRLRGLSLREARRGLRWRLRAEKAGFRFGAEFRRRFS